MPGVDQHERFGGGGAGLGHGVGNVLGALAAAGQEYSVGEGAHRGELGMALLEEALGGAGQVSRPHSPAHFSSLPRIAKSVPSAWKSLAVARLASSPRG